MLFTLVANLSALLTILFFTASPSLLKSTGAGTNLSISSLSNSVFKLTKFAFTAKPEVLTFEIFLISGFVS